MAVKTFNPAGASDNWSTAAAWGGALPADGDSWVITVGKTLVFDVDLSSAPYSWVTGCAGITITSIASGTPAQLTCPTAGGPYVLVMKDNAGIAGTNLATKGQLYIGTSAAVPLPQAVTFRFEMLGSASSFGFVDQTHLDIKIYGAVPSVQWVKVTANTATGGGAANVTFPVDTDVTALPDWAAGAIIRVVNLGRVSTDSRRAAIVSSTATTLTLSMTGSTWPATIVQDSYLLLIAMNVTMRLPAVNVQSSTGGFRGVNTAAGNVINICLVRGDASTQNGGTLGFYQTKGTSMNIAIDGMSHAFNANSGCSIRGVVGCIGVGVQSCNGMYVGPGVYGGSGASGVIRGCSATNVDPGAIVAGVAQGISDAATVNFAGKLYGCGFGVIGGTVNLLRQAVLGGAGNLANTADVNVLNGTITGYGTRLQSATPVYFQYTGINNTGLPPGNSFATFYDYADGSGNPQYGQIKSWMPAGRIFSEAAPGSPPVTLPFAQKMLWETAGFPLYIDIPIVLEADTPVKITFYVQCASNMNLAWDTSPEIRLISPEYVFGSASAYIGSAATTAAGGGVDVTNSSSWQTLEINYLPAAVTTSYPRGAKRNAYIRFTGTLNSAAVPTANTYLDWNYTQSAIVNANVQYVSGNQETLLTTPEFLHYLGG